MIPAVNITQGFVITAGTAVGAGAAADDVSSTRVHACGPASDDEFCFTTAARVVGKNLSRLLTSTEPRRVTVVGCGVATIVYALQISG